MSDKIEDTARRDTDATNSSPGAAAGADKGRSAAAAVRRLLGQLPPDAKLDVSEEEMVQLLKGVIGDSALIPLEDARRYFRSPAELVARGRGELTLREAINLLGVDEPTVIALMRDGTLRARTVRERSTLVDAASVRAYLESRGQPVLKADDSVALLMSALRKMRGIISLEDVLYAGCVICGHSDYPATHVIEGYGNVCYRHAASDPRARPEPWAEEITALHKRGLRYEEEE